MINSLANVLVIIGLIIVFWWLWNRYRALEKQARFISRLQRFDQNIDNLSPNWRIRRALRRERRYKNKKRH